MVSHDNNHIVKLVNNTVNYIRCQLDSDDNNVTNETLRDIDISMDIVWMVTHQNCYIFSSAFFKIILFVL